MAIAKAERLMNLALCLLGTRRPLTKRELRGSIEAYLQTDTANDEAFNRMFERGNRSGKSYVCGWLCFAKYLRDRSRAGDTYWCVGQTLDRGLCVAAIASRFRPDGECGSGR